MNALRDSFRTTTPESPPPPSTVGSPNTSRRFTLGASNVCLVGLKPDLLCPGIVGMRGCVYGHTTTAILGVHDNHNERSHPFPSHLMVRVAPLPGRGSYDITIPSAAQPGWYSIGISRSGERGYVFDCSYKFEVVSSLRATSS